MIYYIDFDNTLFNTEDFYRDLLILLKKFYINEEDINEYYDSLSKNQLFNPLKIISKITENNPLKIKIEKEINCFFSDLSKYLYDDAIVFLEYLNSKNYQINLLTYGDYDYQNLKINNSFIKDYFNKLIITSRNKFDLGLDYQNSIFIDDDIKQINGLLSKKAKVIRIRREGNKHSIDDLTNVLEFKNLKGYLDKIKDI